MQFKSYILTALAALALAAPAWAHHSHANYDLNQFLIMDGTVTEVFWINPHVWLSIEVVNEEGEPNVSVLEGASVGQLLRDGGVKTPW